MKHILPVLFVLSMYSTPAAAQLPGRRVFLNGMDLASYMLVDVELKCVNVRFDEKGNITIVAPGYKFESTGKEAPPPAEESPADVRANRYYIVTFPKPNKIDTGYDIDVHINGKSVRRVRGGGDQEVIEVTQHMQTGKNEVSFISVRRKGYKPPAKPVHGSVRYAIARGYEEKGTYVMRDILWEITRATTDNKANFVDKHTITVPAR